LNNAEIVVSHKTTAFVLIVDRWSGCCGPEVSDLFRAPAGIRVPHVGGRFNRRQELERAITHTNEPDDCARNDAQDVVLEDDATDEDVD
jgi:hypothetical protein